MLLALGVSFAVTGAVSSAYHKQRIVLGAEHYERGSDEAATGHALQATDEFRTALLFSPDNMPYRLSLALALLNSGRLDEAQAHLEELKQDDPTSGRVNLALARVESKRGHLKNAIAYYQQAVYEYWPADQIPERRQGRWELVDLLERTGRRNEAVGELIQLYASAPPNDTAERSRIGFAMLKFGALSEAARLFGGLEKASPHLAEVHRGLGEVYFAMGDYVSARHEFQHALHVDAKDHQSVDDLALTNAVIDLDPLLPRIGSSERDRRSRNLLSRVVADVTSCSSGRTLASYLEQELANANSLLQAPKKNAARTQPDDLQQAALQLWRDRASFCEAGQATDRAVEVALSKMSDE